MNGLLEEQVGDDGLWQSLGVMSTSSLLSGHKSQSSSSDEFPGEKFISTEFLLEDVSFRKIRVQRKPLPAFAIV